MVNLSLETVTESAERESLLSLKSDLEQLIQLTRENLDALVPKNTETTETQSSETKDELDDEYALFMVNIRILFNVLFACLCIHFHCLIIIVVLQQEMAKSGAYETSKEATSENSKDVPDGDDSDIEVVYLIKDYYFV